MRDAIDERKDIIDKMEDDPYAAEFMTSTSITRTISNKCKSLKSMSQSSTAFTTKLSKSEIKKLSLEQIDEKVKKVEDAY